MSRKEDVSTRRARLSPAKQALLQRRLRSKPEVDSKPGTIPRRGEADLSPLSFGQERIWFLDQLEPGDPAYNRPVFLRLIGRLKAAALEESLNEIVRRHEALRTVVQAVEGRPIQVVAPTLTISIPVVDLSNLPEGERKEQSQGLATEEARRPFDLAKGPLLRAALLRLSEEEHLLLLVMHHIVFDAWSVRVLLRELRALYDAFSAGNSSTLSELPIQYADFAHWQRSWMDGDVLEDRLAYWRQRLEGAPPVLQLPTDRPRPAVQTSHGDRRSITLPKALSRSLKDLSQKEGVTSFMTLLAAFGTLLHRYTGQDDIIVGSPVAGRDRVETEGLIGVFINTIALRTDLSGNPTFRELLGRVRETAIGAYAHQDLPFEKLVEELKPERDLSHTPLFQVMFNYEAFPDRFTETQGLRISEFELDNKVALFDLTLEIVSKDEELLCIFEYNRDLFEEATIERSLGHFETLLAGIVADPQQHLSHLPLITEGERQSLVLSKTLSESLNSLSRGEGVTLFMTLLGAFVTLLHRYTGQEDIVVGSPIAGRTRVEIEELIGFFVNTLALRTDLSGNPTFLKLLGRVREVALAAGSHQDLPFEKLVEELQTERNLTMSPLFQVMFALQNTPGEALDLPGLSVSPLEIHNGTAKFDLTLSMIEQEEGLRGWMVYNTDMFDAVTIERMSGHYQTLLEGIVADPEQRLSELTLLRAAERHQLLVEWNDTRTDYPKDKPIHQLFEAQVERTPEAVAVIFEDQQLTYRELNNRANRLAHYLRRQGVGPETLVGISVERSLEMVVGILGILKSGGAYVPLDPSYPKERLAFMLKDTQAPVLLTQQRLIENLPQHRAHVVCLDTGWEGIAGENAGNPTSDVNTDNLAYVIYTSGSTGMPKGVMISHGAICDRLFWFQDVYQLTEADRILQKTPLSFDVSVREFFWPLSVGARLIMARPGGHSDSAYLIKLVSEQKITILNFVPSMLQVFLTEQGLENCHCLRRVICGGEALSIDLQKCFFSLLPAELHNHYGPTEVSVNATFWTCERGSGHQVVPIGRPVANTQIYLLDAYLQPVPIGVPGELLIGGAGLARGYLNQPELNTERFIPNPFSEEPGARLYKTGDLARYLPNGNIEFLGRIDDQVQIRGFRIELGEIEAVLQGQPSVGEAVVVRREDEPGDVRLVAYVVPNREQEPSISELRRFLQKKLPDYMVPSVFVMLDSFPLTPSGKLDRLVLPAPDLARPEIEQPFVAPRSPLEKVIAKIWSQVISLQQVGVHDSFFDLGGHSLLATQVISRLGDAFQIELPLRSLFEAPTVAELAQAMIATDREPGTVEKIASILDRIEGMPEEDMVNALREKRNRRNRC